MLRRKRWASVFALMCCGWALANVANAQVAAKKEEAGVFPGKWYGTVELRHHLNTYYDAQGYYAHQDPSVHARLQLGTQLYDSMVDVYTTFGVFRIPRTQQILQRQPELALDLYPFRNPYLTLLQYNLVRLPVKADATAPSVEDEKADVPVDTGTTYIVGIAPTARYPFDLSGHRLTIKGGVDVWTRLYSRRQYLGPTMGPADEDDEGRIGFAALENEEQPAEPIEDYALHYRTQALAGVEYEPAVLRGLRGELTAHHHTRYDPRYTRSETGDVDYKYGAERYSYYRIRLSYEFSERVAVTNDFYHFYDGAFQGRRSGDERRFRNVARLSCRL